MIPVSIRRLAYDLRNLATFTSAYILAFAATAYAKRNEEFIFYLLVMLILIASIVILHRRISLSKNLLWLLSIWGLLHMMGGLLTIPEDWVEGNQTPVLYNLWLIPKYLKYDQLIHAYGFGISTWLCWQCLCFIVRKNRNSKLKPTFGVLILSILASSGLGAFNEVIEFIATMLVSETNVGDYENTSWDLVFNLIGGAIAAFSIYFTYRET